MADRLDEKPQADVDSPSNTLVGIVGDLRRLPVEVLPLSSLHGGITPRPGQSEKRVNAPAQMEEDFPPLRSGSDAVVAVQDVPMRPLCDPSPELRRVRRPASPKLFSCRD